jgi:hypothetical protein
MEPRSPDPSYRMRLIDGMDDTDDLDYLNQEFTLTQEEMDQIDSINKIIIESKKNDMEDLICKLSFCKNRICMFSRPELNLENTIIQFNKLEEKIKEYINSLEQCIPIDLDLKNFIDWLCTKTFFSRYKLDNKLKKIFI